ncbi:hypothetical protein AGMMS49975_14410 [Clostridia bacterium]|nr:hypothetical protein AGMMS49975_14410 [Clostridia bacterium]
MKIGLAITGSFCTLSNFIKDIKCLAEYADITPIFSETVQKTDTRYAKAEYSKGYNTGILLNLLEKDDTIRFSINRKA